MRIAGFLLLPAGFGIVLSAIVLLRAGVPQGAFVLAGVAIEILGLVQIFRSYPRPRAPEDR